MILLKTKKVYQWEIQKFFYNLIFNKIYIYKYKKPKIYRAITYSAAILLMTDCYTRGKSFFFFIKYNLLNIKDFKEDSDWLYIIRLAKSKYWWNRRVRMFFFFNNFKLISYLAYFDHFIMNKIFYNYNFFFNMIIYKNLCVKIYNLYKRVHLMEFLMKIYYPFEASYLNILTNEENILFDSFYFYHYPIICINSCNVYCENFIEYFPLKNNFFKNNFYSYFYKNTSVYFSNTNKVSPLYVRFTELNHKNFLVHKFYTINDRIFFKNFNLINLKSLYYLQASSHDKIYYFYLYKIFILLIFFL